MRTSALLLAGLLAAACAGTPPAREPAGKAAAAAAAKGPAGAPAAAAPFPARPTLADLRVRIEAIPAMAVARAAAAARAAEVEQAGRPPNPVVAVRQRVEPADLSGGVRKTSLDASQRFETAGKRDARVRTARATAAGAAAEIDAERLRVAGAAALAHQEAAGAARVVAARKQALAVAEDVVTVTRSLVRAGRAEESVLPPLVAATGRLGVELADAERTERTALRRLEALLALPPGAIEGAAGDLLDAAALPAPADARFDDHPDLRVLRAEREAAAARVREEQALAVPDLTVGLGFESSREGERDADTLGIGVEMALPVFDSNRGGIRAARAGQRRADAAVEDGLARLRGAYAELFEETRSLAANRRTYREEILPALERDLSLAEAARRSGRVDRTRVLAARAALAAARVEAAGIDSRLAARAASALALLNRL